jgi:hypothetical protein
MQDKIYLKVEQAKKELKPVLDKVKEINTALDGINVYKIDKLMELIRTFNRMSDDEKRLFEILIKETK